MLERIEVTNSAVTEIELPVSQMMEIPVDNFDQTIEKFITTSELFSNREKTIDALENFYELCGKFFAEDAFYEQRMCLFWDMYIFYTSFLRDIKTDDEMDNVPEELSDCLENVCYSLFKIKKLKNEAMLVVDEISGDKIWISPRMNQSFAGMNKSDYIQGFLYLKNGQNFLSHGLIIHPLQAKKAIQKVVKNRPLNSNCDRLNLLCDLSKIHLRHVRHMHVAPERIYSELC